MSVMQKQYQKVLRALMKKPGNKQCADCGEQCPANVDINHGIFLCASCAGIHREFGDRIKSVSMASFTQNEIMLLQKQTNDDFNKVYMAKWNPHEDPLPLNVDDNRKRSFLQLKYIQKIWYSKDKYDNNNDNKNNIDSNKAHTIQMKSNQPDSINRSNPFHNAIFQPIQNFQEKSQKTNNVQSKPEPDLLDFDFIPQSSVNTKQTQVVQQHGNLIEFGENQNNSQNSSIQDLKSLIEGMDQACPTNNPIDSFKTNVGNSNNNNNFNNMNYHFTNPRNNYSMFAPNYRTGGFGGDSTMNSFNYSYTSKNALYMNSYNNQNKSIAPNNNNLFISGNRF